MERVANDPPTFALRLHPDGGSWRGHSDYNGSATITVHGAVAVIQAFTAQVFQRGTKAAIMAAVARECALALIGTHGVNGRLVVWMVRGDENA